MTIATKNGSVIIKDGSVAQNCGCCGGWSCYKPENSCSSLIQQISNTVSAVRLSVTTQSLQYQRTHTQTLSPAPGFNALGCITVLPFFGCSTMESTWSFSSENISGTHVLDRYLSPSVPSGQIQYRKVVGGVTFSASFGCFGGSLFLSIGAFLDMPGALVADAPTCGDGSYVITGNGTVNAVASIDLGRPAGVLCELFPEGIELTGTAQNNFTVPCWGVVSGGVPEPGEKGAWDGAYFYQDLYKPALLDSGPMTATLELL